ncbi:hypothetical protein [Leptobacterium sp. I13]|uniref:hypothetical protein n=1 Tax=Leptobacterium meishanense TaxID=3128904 RepID=UPI0030ED27E0
MRPIHIQYQLLCAISILLILTSCKNNKPKYIPGTLTHYIHKTGLKGVTVNSQFIANVDKNNIDKWAAKVVDHAAGISIIDSINFQVFKVADQAGFQNKRDRIIEDFKKRNHIKVGDNIIKTVWFRNNASFLETYSTERADGTSFEPVIHFHIDDIESVYVPAKKGSWSIKDRELYVKNGYGIKVARGIWDIIIRCGDKCDIVGPPIKVINTLCDEAWLWAAACNDGFRVYTEPKKSCPDGKQECMQWVIQLGYTRPDNVSVEVGASATLYGVTLRGKIDSNDIAWGGTKADWGILCAESGDITSPTTEVAIGNTSIGGTVVGYREDQNRPVIGNNHGAWKNLSEFRTFIKDVINDPDAGMDTRCWEIRGELVSDDGTPDGLTIKVTAVKEIPCIE